MGQHYDYLDKIRSSYSGFGAYSRQSDRHTLSSSLNSLGRAQEKLQEMRSRTGIEGSIAERFNEAAGVIDERFERLSTKVTKSQDNADRAAEAMRLATHAADALPPEGESPFTAARKLGVENVYSILGGGIHFPDEDMRLWQASLVEEAREDEAKIARERFDRALGGITFEDPSEKGPGGPATRTPGGVPPGGNVAPPPTIAPPGTGGPTPPGGGGNGPNPPRLDLPSGPQPPQPPHRPYDPPVLPPPVDEPRFNPPLPPPGGNDNPYGPPDFPGGGPGPDGPTGPEGPGVSPWDPGPGGGDGPGYGTDPGEWPGSGGGPGAGDGSGAGRFVPGVAAGAALGGAGLLAARGLGGGTGGMSGMSGMPGAAGMGGRGGAGMAPGAGLAGPGGAGAGGAGAAGARGGTTAMVGGQGAAAGGSRGGAAMAPGGMGGGGGRGSDKKRRRKLGLQALQLEAEETDVPLGPESGAGVRDSAAAPRMDTDDLF